MNERSRRVKVRGTLKRENRKADGKQKIPQGQGPGDLEAREPQSGWEAKKVQTQVSRSSSN